MRRIRAEHLLPFACAGAAALLIGSEFMTTFEFNAAGENTLKVSEAADRHSYAMLVLGVFSLGALLIAVGGGSRPAATGVAVAGVAAVLLFLLLDLPDAGQVGIFDDETFRPAKAEPVAGFWLELTGAVVLAICGGALATLNSEQLGALIRSRSEEETPPPRVELTTDKAPTEEKPVRKPRRGRTRAINAPGPEAGTKKPPGGTNSGAPEKAPAKRKKAKAPKTETG